MGLCDSLFNCQISTFPGYAAKLNGIRIRMQGINKLGLESEVFHVLLWNLICFRPCSYIKSQHDFKTRIGRIRNLR